MQPTYNVLILCDTNRLTSAGTRNRSDMRFSSFRREVLLWAWVSRVLFLASICCHDIPQKLYPSQKALIMYELD